MTTRSAMDALIAEIEQAEGPFSEDNAVRFAERAACTPLCRGMDPIDLAEALETGSLDAALSLVPDDCIWKVFSDWPGDVFWAVVERQPEHAPHRVAEYRSPNAPTPALALCIAALKARRETT